MEKNRYLSGWLFGLGVADADAQETKYPLLARRGNRVDQERRIQLRLKNPRLISQIIQSIFSEEGYSCESF